MSRRITFLLLGAFGSLLLGSLLLHRQSHRPRQSSQDNPAAVSPGSHSPSGVAPGPTSTLTPVQAKASPLSLGMPQLGKVQVPAKSGVMVQLQFGPEETLQLGSHQEIPGTGGKEHRRLEGLSGIYYRVLSPEGNLQVQNVVPDPRVVSYDYRGANGAELAGGVARRENAILALRLPELPAGAVVEIFLIEKKLTVPIQIDKMKSLGSFVVTH